MRLVEMDGVGVRRVGLDSTGQGGLGLMGFVQIHTISSVQCLSFACPWRSDVLVRLIVCIAN